ncbi:MAG: hypothetical protein ABFD96_06080 [Armatimonadia bacterium]
MKIDEKQIPDEVVEAAAKELAHTNGWRNQQGIYVCEPVARDIIVAALSAWPGASRKQSNEHVALFNPDPALILPLPKEGE